MALETLKLLLGIVDNSKDTTLTILIEMAKNNAISITNNELVEENEYIIVRMAQYLYLQLGSENLTQQSLAGVSEGYIIDYPETVKQHLRGYSKIKSI